jgi:uncharacterized protein YfiM (DUF2279 family)
MTLPLAPQDKANHFLYGATVCAAVAVATQQPNAGLIAAVVLGFAKEAYDLVSKRGTPDWRDVAWTAAGGLVVWVGNV